MLSEELGLQKLPPHHRKQKQFPNKLLLTQVGNIWVGWTQFPNTTSADSTHNKSESNHRSGSLMVRYVSVTLPQMLNFNYKQ